MKRKWIAFIAAVLMLFMLFPMGALALTQRQTVITATVEIPDVAISVSVPTGGNVYINPESVSVEIDGRVQNGQILSETAYIENQSIVPVSVSASVLGEPKGGLLLRPSTTVGTTVLSKGAFVYFQLRAVANPHSTNPFEDSYDSEKDIVVAKGTRRKKDYVTLAAGDQDERYGMFRLTGDCVEEPRVPWTDEDGFTATIVFTFKALGRS